MSRLSFAFALGTAWLATGCVVLPLNADGTYAYPVGTSPQPPIVLSPPAAQTLPVRLYPTNDVAAATGVIAGSVTNHLTGRGTFTLNVGSETMSGEATRLGNAGASSTHQGVANAYGSRGSFANCRYTMNSPAQGSGSCKFSNGAQYQLHIGT